MWTKTFLAKSDHTQRTAQILFKTSATLFTLPLVLGWTFRRDLKLPPPPLRKPWFKTCTAGVKADERSKSRCIQPPQLYGSPGRLSICTFQTWVEDRRKAALAVYKVSGGGYYDNGDETFALKLIKKRPNQGKRGENWLDYWHNAQFV